MLPKPPNSVVNPLVGDIPVGGDLTGLFPNPQVKRVHFSDEDPILEVSPGNLVMAGFNQQGYSVLHLYDAYSDNIEITRDILCIVRNTSGGPIDRGAAVYLTGSTGVVATVAMAKANSSATMPAIGIMYDNTPNNGYGRMMMIGFIEHIDMSGFLDGDKLYVSALFAGGLTSTPPTSPNIAQFVGCVINNGVGNGVLGVRVQTLTTASGIVGGQPLTKTDDTNVTLTLTGTPTTALLTAVNVAVGWVGTLAAGRLNSNVVQAVVNDTNVTGSIAAQTLTLGWTGTLAAGRLNSNVVQAVVNDTNVTGGIAAQTLTLGWTGTLSVARGGTGLSSIPTNGQLLIGNGASFVLSTLTGTANQVIVTNGAGTITLSTPQNIDTLANVAFGTTTLQRGSFVDLLSLVGNSANTNWGIDFFDTVTSVGTIQMTTTGLFAFNALGGNVFSFQISGTPWLSTDVSGRTTFAARLTLNANMVVASGTLTASLPFISQTVTWNNIGITFTNFIMTVTDTASASGSLFLDFKVGATSKFSVRKDGVITVGTVLTSSLSGIVAIANGGTGLLTVPTNGQLLIGNGTNYTLATITGTTNQVIVTNGAGSITLSLPQNINTAASVQFGLLSLGQAITTVTIDGVAYTTGVVYPSGNGTGGLISGRNTSAGAGANLCISAAGAFSGGTNLAGGDLLLYPGLTTGTGRSEVRVKGYIYGASGTADNTAVDRAIFNCLKTLTNNSAIALVNCTLAAGSIIAIEISYAVEVTNGTDYQTERGRVTFTGVNKGGVFTMGTPAKFGNLQSLSSAATLTVTFTISSANPAVISVNANSSLASISTGYPRITFSIQNYTQQVIAIQ